MDSLLAMRAQRRSVGQTAGRPWPLPGGHWIVGQSWLDLAFVHWQVARSDLRHLVPAELELDSFEDHCWVGIVPFRMRTVHFAGCPPVLGTSAFPEVNVRTYVVQRGKPGVFFLSLDARNPLAITLGRRMYGLPYFHARIGMRAGSAEVRFESDRDDRIAREASFAATYRATAPARLAAPGTLEHWLTERYCFYTVGPGEGLHRTEVHHEPWRLQPGSVNITRNTLLDPSGISPLSDDPLVHCSKAQHVVAWRPRRLVD